MGCPLARSSVDIIVGMVAGMVVDMVLAKDHNDAMSGNHDHFGMQEAWDRASKVYLERRGDDVRAVSYGNLAPSDDTLALLGDLTGGRVLDIGCGGGQNAVACALAGAAVVGVDVSEVQLAAARRLAQAHGVAVEWRQGDALGIAAEQAASFDCVLAIQVLPYVDDPAAVLRMARALLRPGGMLIMSMDHPVRNCFYDTEMDELSPYPVRSYEDNTPLLWNFTAGLPMRAYHHPLGQWLAWVVAAGLVVQQVIELPAPPEICDELWPEDSPLAPLRNLPHTAILVATPGV
jgi:SAM-dependent methyltransferase